MEETKIMDPEARKWAFFKKPTHGKGEGKVSEKIPCDRSVARSPQGEKCREGKERGGLKPV